ncbi:hypothetical protein GCM10011374_41180 [Kocuria dechangensis]|uniref:Uncharacterized protein n=1 Tax=Kocuria dechangensis TaxID=1176249 RepID=A0A917HAZ4_9MICC|nr:hypothetical protein [Kocuria dechangensis]GGG72178.1 hypothetical protein GCM10011374_41180 [Kocuria dechangensis]
MSVAVPSPALGHAPVVGSFALAARVRMTSAGTRARLAVALPEEVKAPATTLVPALLSLGQQVLVEHRLAGQDLPEVEVTAVERAETLPASAAATGFTVGVTNDLAAQRSTVVLDLDYLLGNDGGVLLVAATLFAGAEHLLAGGDKPAHRRSSPGRKRQPSSSSRRRGRGRSRR